MVQKFIFLVLLVHYFDQVSDYTNVMSIFKYHSFRKFLKSVQDELPKKGRGTITQWASVIQSTPTLMSQILMGNKSMSLEMVDRLSAHLQLSEKEKDYFILLVEFDRAGTKSLKDYFLKKITLMQDESRYLKNQIKDIVELPAEVKAIYYSQWVYVGIRNLVACTKIANIESISEELNLPRETIANVIDFLVKHQLIIPAKQGWAPGPQSTFIPADSPLVYKHHQNWRLKGIQQMDLQSKDDLFYTSPMSLSEELAKDLRSRIVKVIQDFQKDIGPSESEVVRCLNIDWFEY